MIIRPRDSALCRNTFPITPCRTGWAFLRFGYFEAQGKRLGRQPGERPKSDRLAPKVFALLAKGRSYSLIGREVGLSKNTISEIVKRNRFALVDR